MLVNELSTRDCLVRMVRRLTGNRALREDLLQEALVHLWVTEVARAGQTRSWYLQSCKYHLLHYLAAGRSVDSAKRRDAQVAQAEPDQVPDYLMDDADSGESVFDLVSARDIISLLSPQLNRQEQAVLDCFAEGLRLREIGRKLKMSHTMVIRHRKRIASLLARLDKPLAVLTEQAADNGAQPKTRSAPQAALVISESPVNGFRAPRFSIAHAAAR